MKKDVLHNNFSNSRRRGNIFTRWLSSERLDKSFEARVPGLMDSDFFRDEIEREMLRSDRTLIPITLLVFDARGSHMDADRRAKCLERLGNIVSDCARRVDSKGWFRDADGLRVGLMLHHAHPHQAERVIRTVRGHFQEFARKNNGHNGNWLDISCEIYSYPHNKQNGGNGSDREHVEGDLTVEPLEKQIRVTAVHDVDAARNGTSQFAGMERDTHDVIVKAEPADRFMGRPLPGWKRMLDIVGASVGIVVLSPALFLIAVGIKATSRGPIFFKQDRVGYLGRTFTFWKFRSMRVNFDTSEHEQYLHRLIEGDGNGSEDNDQPMQKLDDVNPQITTIGRILRATSLDELPQLINVLRGEMSLVGPRPCLPYEAEKYLLWNRRRFDVVPGITGLWQVMGKNKLTFKQMIRLDINYSDRRSFWLDLKILFLTFPAVAQEARESLFKTKPETNSAMEGKHVQEA